MSVESKLDEIIKQNAVLVDYIVSAYKYRTDLRVKFPNLKAGDLTTEALDRHAFNLGGLPSIEQLKDYISTLDPQESYGKEELKHHFEMDACQIEAFLFFCEAAKLLEKQNRMWCVFHSGEPITNESSIDKFGYIVKSTPSDLSYSVDSI